MRTTGKGALGALALLAVTAGGAGAAAPLSTGLLLVTTNQEYLRCLVSNTSAKEVVVEISTVDNAGVSTVRGSYTLAPNASEQDVFIFTSARCVFTTKKPKSLRAYGCVSKLASLDCLAQSEAR